MTELSLTMRCADGATLVTITGDIDFGSRVCLGEYLRYALGRTGSSLLLDLSEVGFIDFAGLSMLLSTQRQAVLMGGGMRLAAVSSSVRQLIVRAHLERVLRMPTGADGGPPAAPFPATYPVGGYAAAARAGSSLVAGSKPDLNPKASRTCDDRESTRHGSDLRSVC